MTTAGVTLHALAEAAQAASPEEMAARACAWLARRLRAPWVEALAAEEGRLRRWAGVGLPWPQEGLEAPQLAAAAEAAEPVSVAPPPWAAALGARVGMAAPVLVEGKVWGIVAAYRRRPFLRRHQEAMALAAAVLGLGLGRWRLARELAEASVRLKAITDNPHHLVCELDREGRIVGLSEAFFGLIGAPGKSLLGRPVTAFLHPADLPAVLEAIKAPWGRVFFRWWHPRGEWVWLDGVGSRFRTPAGEPRGLILLRDISQEKNLEEALAAVKEEKEAILETLREGVVILDLGLRVEWANTVMEALTGRPRPQLVGLPLDSLLAPERRGRVQEAVFRCLAEGEETTRIDVDLEAGDGERIPVEMALRLLRHGQRPVALVASFVDLRERKEREERIREQQEFLEVVLNSLTDGVYLVDDQRRIVWANEAMERLTGYSRQELVGRPISSLVSPEHDALAQEMRRRKLRGEARVTRYEVEFITKDGRRLPVEIHSALLCGREGAGVAVAIARDISERRLMQERLAYMADHDPLTGLFNRRRFLEELERELDRLARYGGQAAFLWLDLDGFKEVNDRFGHAVGDQVLQEVARVLQESVRRSDVVGRLGGDEFGVLLLHAEEEEAREVAHRIRSSLAKITVPGGAPIRVSASVGIAMLGGEGLAVQELLVRADRAMYHAKRRGDGHGVSVWGRELGRGGHEEVSWVRRAMDEGLLRLYCQPILDLRRGRITRYELLLRVVEGDEVLPPAPFIREAEQEGLIGEVDRWVMQEAARLLRRLGRETALHVDVHINLSGQSISRPDLVAALRGLPSWDGRLVLEVTETTAIADLEEAHRYMLEFKALGCKFAVDDFGVGYSSLYHLTRLPFDFLKLDGSLIRELAHRAADQVVVRHVVRAAEELGLEVVAEQVEDEETLALLREMGVHYAQGYHIGRPRPLEEEWPQLAASS